MSHGGQAAHQGQALQYVPSLALGLDLPDELIGFGPGQAGS